MEVTIKKFYQLLKKENAEYIYHDRHGSSYELSVNLVTVA